MRQKNCQLVKSFLVYKRIVMRESEVVFGQDSGCSVCRALVHPACSLEFKFDIYTQQTGSLIILLFDQQALRRLHSIRYCIAFVYTKQALLF